MLRYLNDSISLMISSLVRNKHFLLKHARINNKELSLDDTVLIEVSKVSSSQVRYKQWLNPIPP